MEQTRKILIIDKSAERKKRIQALKSRGFAVYPALNISEARNRCKPGAYDLIVVNSGDEHATAVELCDEILQRAPKQLMLLMTDQDTPVEGRDYTVSNNEDELVKRVESMLNRRSITNDVAVAA
jgi:DNA-binding response OmpR family regulator